MVRHLAAEPVNAVRHSPTRHRRWVRYTAALSAAAVLVFAISGVGFAYIQLQSNIHTGNENTLLDESNRPKRVGAAPEPGDPFSGRALNIVLIGSDSRAGDNQALGGGNVSGMRSDTTILVHVSQDRSRVDLISFPRDLMVTIPACKRSDGSSSGASFGQFNAAFAYGGQNGDATSAAACTIGTIETLTDIRVDGFVVIDMSGFEKVIDAMGGVDLCIPAAIDAPKADLVLAAGMQHLNGKTALGYARARTGVGLGDGSDLTRITRQQKLMGALSKKILSSQVLTSPAKLYGVLNSVTQSLTMTKDYASVPALAGLGVSLAGLSPNHMAFVTVPYGAYAPDPNRVAVLEPQASTLFETVRDDQPIEGTVAYKDAHKSKKPKPSATVTADNAALTSNAATLRTAELAAANDALGGSPAWARTVAGSGSPTPTPEPTEANPFNAKNGGVDDDVCAGQ